MIWIFLGITILVVFMIVERERFITFVENHDKFMVAFSTCVIALFTIALFIATLQLYQGGEKNSERQLRAYVSATANYVFAFSPDIPVQIKFVMTNHGQTPAYRVSQSSTVDILPYPLPSEFTLPDSAASTGSFVLHPNASLDGIVTARRNFSKDEINDVVLNKGKRIYIYGTVRYQDFLGIDRTTNFCYTIIGDKNLLAVSGGIPIPTVKINFSPSEAFNQAN